MRLKTPRAYILQTVRFNLAAATIATLIVLGVGIYFLVDSYLLRTELVSLISSFSSDSASGNQALELARDFRERALWAGLALIVGSSMIVFLAMFSLNAGMDLLKRLIDRTRRRISPRLAEAEESEIQTLNLRGIERIAIVTVLLASLALGSAFLVAEIYSINTPDNYFELTLISVLLTTVLIGGPVMVWYTWRSRLSPYLVPEAARWFGFYTGACLTFGLLLVFCFYSFLGFVVIPVLEQWAFANNEDLDTIAKLLRGTPEQTDRALAVIRELKVDLSTSGFFEFFLAEFQWQFLLTAAIAILALIIVAYPFIYVTVPQRKGRSLDLVQLLIVGAASFGVIQIAEALVKMSISIGGTIATVSLTSIIMLAIKKCLDILIGKQFWICPQCSFSNNHPEADFCGACKEARA